jgi:hypothetical protein
MVRPNAGRLTWLPPSDVAAMSPSRSVSATIAGSAARIWSRARLESRQTRPIRFRLVWAAQAKVKAAAQRETTPRPGHPPHPRSALLPPTESLGVTTQCEQGGARSPGHQSRRVEIGSRAYFSAPRGEVSPLLRWAFSGRLASALDGFAVDGAHRGRGAREGGPARRLRRTRIPTRRHSRRSRAERRLRTR